MYIAISSDEMTTKLNYWKRFISYTKSYFVITKEYLSRLQRQTSGVQEEPDLFEDTGLRQQHVLAMEEAESVSKH